MFDLMTLCGIILGFLLFVIAGLTKSGGNPFLFIDPASMAITFGGALSSTLARFAFQDIKNVPYVLKQAFVTEDYDPEGLIEEITGYADIARRDGILALESEIENIDDDFLVRGIQLAVDGTDPELIQSMLMTEMNKIIERHKRGREVFEYLVEVCPSFGMIGTVMGLIVMLKNLDNPDAIGPSMALALMTTFYGVFAAFLVFKPIANKLALRSDEEMLVKDMIIEGIMAIQSGDNPRIVRQKLEIFLKPDQRESTNE